MSEPAEPQVEKPKRTKLSSRDGSMPQRRPRTPRRKQIGEGTNLTDAISEKICEAVRIAAPLDVARAYAGIPAPTFAEWLRAGREGYEPYATLVEKIDFAMAEGQMRDIARVDAGADKDWRASGFKLERRWPQHWAEKKQIDTTVSGRPFIDPSKLTLEEQLQLRALLAKAAPEAADLPRGGLAAGEILAASIDGEVVSEEDVA
jgi:hypothetical protein